MTYKKYCSIKYTSIYTLHSKHKCKQKMNTFIANYDTTWKQNSDTTTRTILLVISLSQLYPYNALQN